RRDFGPPSGTYVGIRDTGGSLTGRVFRLDTTSKAALPDIPANPPLGRIITVSGTGSSKYRLLAERDPFDGGTRIVAVPLREASATLNRLLVVEGLVIAAVLAALAAVAWVVVRVGLLPL